MSTKSLWDDSECTVEEEYSSPASANNPNCSTQFINKLTSNKGDISTARMLIVRKSSEIPRIKICKIQDSWDDISEKEGF